jgi:hypothetical protein
MEVEYVLTVEDYVAFNKYQQAALRKPRLSMSWWWPVLLLILIGLFFLPSLSGPKRERPPDPADGQSTNSAFMFIALPALVIGVALLVWATRYLLPYQVKRFVTHPDNQKRLLGLRRTSIGPEGVAVRGEAIHTTVGWAAVRKIVLTQEHAFFYITTLEAIIVPRRPFASDEEFQEFAQTARDYRKMARQAAPESKAADRMASPETDLSIKPEERARD